MTEDEFRKKMDELGWDNEYADEIIKNREKAILAGITPLPFEAYLIEAPIND